MEFLPSLLHNIKILRYKLCYFCFGKKIQAFFVGFGLLAKKQNLTSAKLLLDTEKNPWAYVTLSGVLGGLINWGAYIQEGLNPGGYKWNKKCFRTTR